MARGILQSQTLCCSYLISGAIVKVFLLNKEETCIDFLSHPKKKCFTEILVFLVTSLNKLYATTSNAFKK